MIIQHNIMAINSHRQLGINNTNLGKNLEKLSSGYRINRAADDAAGLAISEKMRAQITGLDRAILNAQDGASLIQTAEGALQEVHSMLNRMVELATQSANGTYQADDRQKIEAEVDALKEEINRISQATNFNGIQLLDGSLASSSPKNVDVSGVRVSPTAAVAGKYGYMLDGAAPALTDLTGLVENDKFQITVGLNNGESVVVNFTVTQNGDYVEGEDGTIFRLGANGTVSEVDLGRMMEEQLQKSALGNDYIIEYNQTANRIEFTNKVAGTKAPQITGIGVGVNDGITSDQATQLVQDKVSTNYNPPSDEVRTIRSSSFVVFTPNPGGATNNEKQATFEVNGEKFILVNANQLSDTSYATAVADLKNRGVNVITIEGDNTPNPDLTADDLVNIAEAINHKTGLAFEVNAADDGIIIKAKPGGNGLTMQVGDTADDFNKITVSVEDMSAAGLNISNISMKTQEAAANSLTRIKSAIEKVSVNRGNLGALQNRLEYTINNLGVTSENMTAAESRIRDTDMAKEMMQFTKNNVLAQAAQAMLAQANMQPQQVLQLLR